MSASSPAKKDPIKAAYEAQWGRAESDMVVLDLPLPISTNELHRPGWNSFHRSDRYRIWRQAAGVMLNAQRPGRVAGRYTITLLVNRARTKMDLDNSVKSVSDILQAHGVIDNDRHAEEIHLRWSDAIDGTRVYVEKWRRPAEEAA